MLFSLLYVHVHVDDRREYSKTSALGWCKQCFHQSTDDKNCEAGLDSGSFLQRKETIVMK